MSKPYMRIFIQQFVVIGGAGMGKNHTAFVVRLVALKTVVDGMTHRRPHLSAWICDGGCVLARACAAAGDPLDAAMREE